MKYVWGLLDLIQPRKELVNLKIGQQKSKLKTKKKKWEEKQNRASKSCGTISKYLTLSVIKVMGLDEITGV